MVVVKTGVEADSSPARPAAGNGGWAVSAGMDMGMWALEFGGGQAGFRFQQVTVLRFGRAAPVCRRADAVIN